jgi:hypothetical protein
LTTFNAWIFQIENFGGVLLGVFTGLILFASLAIEAFNKKENNYEFSYLLTLITLTIIRYVGGCIHSDDLVFKIVFMVLSIIITLIMALGFVAFGKSLKEMKISIIGFFILASIILIKTFETNLFFVWRAVTFLILDCKSAIFPIKSILT